jgi:SNF2 family DNA or RNA helicase
MIALPHQLVGAEFLAARPRALLADAPRVGKTGAAIIASDYILPERILIVTTASGRPVWARGFRDWSAFAGRKIEVAYGASLTDKHLAADILVVAWSTVWSLSPELVKHRWSLLILDEAHYAKSAVAKRTKAVYGGFRGAARDWGLVDQAESVWCLTGTPIPNAPNDLYPMLRALAPERLSDRYGPTDVSGYETFLHRYCIVRKKRLNAWSSIDVVVGGKNMDELRERMAGFWLRRTQADVGITTPIYEILPLHISDRDLRKIAAEIPEAEDVIAAAETGETKSLDMHLGTLRRITGTLKAEGVASAVEDEFSCGLDKIVVMAWHKDVMDVLESRLSQFGVVRVDGATSPDRRESAMQKFSTDPECRVFIGQIVACGEAIDLSASAELIFAESSFVPKDMSQAAMRITNHGQKRQPRVRVAALEGSIDEAVQAILVRKIATNKEVMRA